MKKEGLYNGLKGDLNSLAKFVFIYEQEIKTLTGGAASFAALSSNGSNLFRIKLQHLMKYATIDEIKTGITFAKRTLFFTKSSTQIFDFCRHLRNSFSHGLIKKEGRNLYITDKKGKSVITSTGYLEHSLVIEFISTVINDYEHKITNNKYGYNETTES